MQSVRYKALLGLIAVAVGCAIWTLLPLSAPKSNDLGYVSACPFAPWSTLLLIVAAGFLWIFRQYLITRPPPGPPIS
ncbi:MAG: hypothetical protein JO022_16030 [Acidobacteriaceae bacterium]|nr:hypothetical protein [Acidobacteriaceae bacterium]